MCRFAAVDARGAVYVFHLRANRYSLAHDARQEVTAVAFSPGRENDIILGLADRSIRIINSDSGATLATLKSHRQAVSSICVHPLGRFLVSCSSDACVLWDLKSLKRMQNVGSSGRIGAIQAAFLHSGNTLITLSRTEGLSLYHFPTLRLRARLTPLSGNETQYKRLEFRSFAITPNRMYIVAATSDLRAYVWHLPSETMVEEISLPVPCATRAYGAGALQALMPYASVEMPESSRVAYVAEDGLIRILDLPSGNVVHSMGVAAHAFAMYKQRIAFSSADGSVQLCSLGEPPAPKEAWVGATTFNRKGWKQQDHGGAAGEQEVGVTSSGLENVPVNRARPLTAPGARPGVDSRDSCDAGASRARVPSRGSLVRGSRDAASGGKRAQPQPLATRVGAGSESGAVRQVGVTGVEVRTSPARGRPVEVPTSPAKGRPKSGRLLSSREAAIEGAAPMAGRADHAQRPPGGAAGAKAQEQAQMVERLRAFLDVHASFTEGHRVNVYRQLLRLPGNSKAHATLVGMGEGEEESCVRRKRGRRSK